MKTEWSNWQDTIQFEMKTEAKNIVYRRQKCGKEEGKRLLTQIDADAQSFVRSWRDSCVIGSVLNRL
jgi:hypothetical protein